MFRHVSRARSSHVEGFWTPLDTLTVPGRLWTSRRSRLKRQRLPTCRWGSHADGGDLHNRAVREICNALRAAYESGEEAP